MVSPLVASVSPQSLEQQGKNIPFASNLLDYEERNFSKEAMQIDLARQLRALAIKHLSKDKGIVASTFRGDYLAVSGSHYRAFLNQQAKNGAWGTYIEAAALGEAFDCNIVVTPLKPGEQGSPICLYRSENPAAKTIHLYNSNNTHWHFHKNQPNLTVGDGNCLYNAITLALYEMVKPSLAQHAQAPNLSSQARSGFFAKEKQVIQQQTAILAAINKQLKPSELRESQTAYQQVFASKTPLEKEQIMADYQLALRLATVDDKQAEKILPGFNVQAMPSSLSMKR